MTTGTTVEYALKKVKGHLNRFNDLYNMLNSGNIDEGYLGQCEWRDTIFQEIDYMAYSDEHNYHHSLQR